MSLIHMNLSLFDWVWTTSARVSILIVLLLIVKLVFKNKTGVHTHYLSWSVVYISLLIPWTPQSPLSLYNLVKIDNSKTLSVMNESTSASPASTFIDSGVMSVIRTSDSLHQVTVAQTNSVEIPNTVTFPNQYRSFLISFATSSFIHRILFFIWISGIVAFMAVTVLVHKKFAQKIQGEFVDDTKWLSVFHETQQKMNVRATIPLILTKAVKTPSLYGLFRPKLLLPVGVLDEFSPAQLNHVFVHEMMHLKRKDILLNWLTRGLLIIHWFNPIIWYAFMKMQEDQELSCDALALSHIGIHQTTEYALTLIKLLECYSGTHRIASLTCLSGTKSQIKRRLRMLKMIKQSSLKWNVLVLVVVILIAVITLTTAKADTSNKANQTLSTANVEINTAASLTPIPLNQALIEQVKAQFGKVKYFPYSSETDIASIAYGRMLTILSNDKLHISKALPTRPLFVKSYDPEVRDYYLVPFVSGGKYVAADIVTTYADGTAGDGGAVVYPLSAVTDKYFKLDANEATAIIRKTYNSKDIPFPKLVYFRTNSANTMDFPFWEFDFAGNKKFYVTQLDGKVLDCIPSSNKDASNVIVKPSQVPGKDWSIAITKLVFKPGINTQNKLASVYLTLYNNNGADKAFLPKGTVVGLVGSSGKYYWLNLPYTIEQEYATGQDWLKEEAQKYGTVYQPGIFTIIPEVLVDTDEKGFTKIIYQDENSSKFEISIQ